MQGAFFFRSSEEALSLAELYAGEAWRTNPRSARARNVLALVHLFWRREPGRALETLESGSVSNGDLEDFHVVRMLALLARGDLAAAKAACNEALAAAPASSIVNLYVGFVLYHAGAVARAGDHLRRMLAIKPYSGFATALLGFTYLAQNEPERARDLFEKLLMPTGQMLTASGKFLQWAVAGLSYIEGRAGNLEISRALSRDLERSPHVSPTLLALSALSRQEYDLAVMRLEAARQSHDLQFPFVYCNPLFDPVKSTPEFLALLSRVAA